MFHGFTSKPQIQQAIGPGNPRAAAWVQVLITLVERARVVDAEQTVEFNGELICQSAPVPIFGREVETLSY